MPIFWKRSNKGRSQEREKKPRDVFNVRANSASVLYGVWPSDIPMKRKLFAIIIALALTMSFAVPLAVAGSPSPAACTSYQSTSNTSSDGTMYVRATEYLCPGGGTSGQVGFEAYSSVGGYSTTSYTACGSIYSTPTAGDLVEVSFYYGTSCGPSYAYNFPYKTLESGSSGTVSGSSTTDITGWSGNCAWGGSACTTTTSASAP